MKKRCIIYNDDGDAQNPRVNPEAAEGPEGFLSARFAHCLDSQVDSYFWCVGNGEEPRWGEEPTAAIGDANEVIIQACRKAGMEVFASLRMNDTHDSFAPSLTYPLKVQRPDLLISTKKAYPDDAYIRLLWSAFDYAHPEVREHRLGFIQRLCHRYDFDGFEMDFYRHPQFFKLEECEQNLGTMTGFVRQVRETLDGIANERGRPYLLAARVADTPEYSLRLGLDVESWLAEGLLDIVVAGGGYKCFDNPFEEFIELGHRYGVQVYPCVNGSCLMGEHGLERLRAMASNFWSLGADGVYLFNMFVPVDLKEYDPEEFYQALSEVGEPETLEGLDKLYELTAEDSHPFVEYTGVPNQLPARLIYGKPLRLRVGDAVERAALKGQLAELQLRTHVAPLLEEESIALKVNGTPVEITNRSPAEDGFWFEATIQSPPLHRGINEIAISPGAGCWGRLATMVRELQLWVRYGRPVS